MIDASPVADAWSVVTGLVLGPGPDIAEIMDVLYADPDVCHPALNIIRRSFEADVLEPDRLVRSLLRAFAFPAKNHLWLLAAALDREWLDAREIAKLLPTLPVGTPNTSRSFLDLYETIEIVTHDRDAFDANDAFQVRNALHGILGDVPSVP